MCPSCSVGLCILNKAVCNNSTCIVHLISSLAPARCVRVHGEPPAVQRAVLHQPGHQTGRHQGQRGPAARQDQQTHQRPVL